MNDWTNHTIQLPAFLTEASQQAIERILRTETAITELVELAGLERRDVPSIDGAHLEDEIVVLYGWRDDFKDEVIPGNVVWSKVYDDGSADYHFIPTRDEYRG